MNDDWWADGHRDAADRLLADLGEKRARLLAENDDLIPQVLAQMALAHAVLARG